MTLVLTVTRQRRDGSATIHRLLALADGQYVVRTESDEGLDGDHVVRGAATALDAVRNSRRLHVAHIEEHTRFTCHDQSVLSPEDLVPALRTQGTEPAVLDDDPDLEDPFIDANYNWFTHHHITVDGTHVFGAAGTPLVVRAEDLDRPYESWPEIISFSWDSSDYAGIGAAGFGTSGGYRPRPDLLALVVATDESLDITFERIRPNTSDHVLVRRTLDAGIFPDSIYAHLALQAFGHNADDLMPGDTVDIALDAAEVRRLLLGHYRGLPGREREKGVAR